MKLKVELEINKGRIADLICSAVEGGWYLKGLIELSKTHRPPKLSKEDLSTVDGWEDGKFCYIYPLFFGGYLTFKDIGEDKPKSYRLNLDKIKSGLKIFAKDYPNQFYNWLNENDDAITGVVFLQCCLFGEEKYG